MIVSKYNDGDDDDYTEWADETVQEWMDERAENGERIPYSVDTIKGAFSLAYEDGYEGNGKFEVEFDDGKLSRPDGYNPDQQLLPGFEPIEPSSYFTDSMRDELSERLEKAFDDFADKKSGDMDVPEYVGENVVEQLEENWEHNLDDDDKFNFVKYKTDIIEEAQKEYDEYYESNGQSGGADEVAIPNTFDPLQNTGDSAEYKKTHALVTFMSRERGIQLLQKRGLVDADRPTSDFRGDVKDVDKELWRDWKDSSAGSFGGQVLQLASAEELSARYRDMPKSREDIIAQANSRYKEIGGFAGVKALVRAKWETSQYALDKAGVNSIEVYRGLRVQMPEDEPVQDVEVDTTAQYNDGLKSSRTYTKFTDAQITRNGMYSTTTKLEVANGWNAGIGTKVVLRLDVPRTAVVSFPAYGINVHSEKEVVLAGTAFRGWDAWKNNAPSTTEVPIKEKKAA
jgi:hypothetical protein